VLRQGRFINSKLSLLRPVSCKRQRKPGSTLAGPFGSFMRSTFDERLWLAWLVKVRIIILTFLLGIELAIARLTPSPMPMRFFVNTILLWYATSLFYLWLVLGVAATAVATAGSH